MIELASVIRDLRGELQAAIGAGRGEALRFDLGPIELEVTVAMDRSGGATGTVRFWVLELSGDHHKDTVSTQRIKLLLTPALAGEPGAPQISGRVERDEQ